MFCPRSDVLVDVPDSFPFVSFVVGSIPGNFFSSHESPSDQRTGLTKEKRRAGPIRLNAV